MKKVQECSQESIKNEWHYVRHTRLSYNANTETYYPNVIHRAEKTTNEDKKEEEAYVKMWTSTIGAEQNKEKQTIEKKLKEVRG